MNGENDGGKSSYEKSLDSLAEKREEIHDGWRKIYDEMLASMKMVQCRRRNRLRIKFQIFSENEFEFENLYQDPVLQGIVRKAKAKSLVTCFQCGEQGKPYKINEQESILCTGCMGLMKFRDEIGIILEVIGKTEGAVDSRVWTEQELGSYLPYVFTSSDWTSIECQKCSQSVKIILPSIMKNRIPKLKNLLRKLDNI